MSGAQFPNLRRLPSACGSGRRSLYIRHPDRPGVRRSRDDDVGVLNEPPTACPLSLSHRRGHDDALSVACDRRAGVQRE